MTTIELAGVKLKIYDSIDELSIIRFHKYNKLLLVDVGLGDNLNDVDAHILRAMKMVKSDPDSAIRELQNLRQNIYLINSELSAKNHAFCCLVAEVDGVPFNDFSDDSIKTLLKKIEDAKQTELTAQIDAVKKKIDEELELYFPTLSNDADNKEHYTRIKKRALLQLDAIIDGKDVMSEIEKIEDAMLLSMKPKLFYSSESVEVQYDKNFEDMCIVLTKHLNRDAKSLTVLSYYQSVEYLKKQNKDGK
jgi:hypothetical protein